MLTKHYDPKSSEAHWAAYWQETGIDIFDPASAAPVYSIDTPPPTVSGHLHLGHVYSYSHTDFMARFWRMNGRNVFYPMGFDDNGLPTERLVEKRLGLRALTIGRRAFIEKCLQVSEEAEQDYKALWQRLGLSIDWRYSYRTIDDFSRRTSQHSFINLYRKGLAYRREAPAIWCPECQTAIAQAEINDLERLSEYVTLPFRLVSGEVLPIATTRPELLPACVAIFVHPEDSRFQALVGQSASVPLFGQSVPILADSAADPQKGTGVVMCCTFGDTTDVAWQQTHHLPLVRIIERDGRLGQAAGPLAGLTVDAARQQVKMLLAAQGLILGHESTQQTIRVHERCDTPVEYLVLRQWFVRALEFKAELLRLGELVEWRPPHMQSRYQAWVENLRWDWCISRQRYFGVPFPLWYCRACGEVILADESQLPVEPTEHMPLAPCPACGGREFTPETDIFDTWATSSLSPQIVGRWLDPASDLYGKVFPFDLRPQAHEIIRTWAFYTLLKTNFHFSTEENTVLPWKNVAISGWGLAGEGMGKISKSRGGGPMAPLEMLGQYSADALRYWAASTGPGKDAIISEERIQAGMGLVTKLWNVARFYERFLADLPPERFAADEFTLADHCILALLKSCTRRTTELFTQYDYAAAKADVEAFFWNDLADNYLEMAKQRLYGPDGLEKEAARYTLSTLLLTVLKLFAPILPFVTEAIYQDLFAQAEGCTSIHRSAWPEAGKLGFDLREWGSEEQLFTAWRSLVEIATAVRRYKSQNNLSLASEIHCLRMVADSAQLDLLRRAEPDLRSITRSQQIVWGEQPGAALALYITLAEGIEAPLQF